MRLDIFLKENNLCKSRQKAADLIKKGFVKVDNLIVKKVSFDVDEKNTIEIIGDDNPFVSRGGLKLQKGIEIFNIDLKDSVCLDIGASTGGFTHCCLINGAKKVYALDVGTSQLDEKLLNDNRVINLEKTNIKFISQKIIPEKIDFICCDVSFISICRVADVLNDFFDEKVICFFLIKPQFEAGRENLNKNGIVKDKKTHISVLNNIVEYFREKDFCLSGLDFSPVKGGDGNIEYISCFLYKGEKSINPQITKIVDNAFENL